MNAELIKECKDIPEVIDVVGFGGSLQSEGWLTGGFQRDFERLLGIARRYRTPVELGAAFREDRTLQRLHDSLQSEVDMVINAHSRWW